eukprot:4669217-Lingulodinium_polyedra.AAC.1
MATEAASRLAAAGLTPALDWPHEAGLMEQPPGQQLAFGEVLFVDDAAYPVQAGSPDELCRAATE